MSATASIGANLEEGAAASSRRDMAHKYSIALRESRESRYWARLGATDANWAATLTPIGQESQEFVAMLTTAVKKLRRPADAAVPLRAKRLDRARRSRSRSRQRV